MQEDIAQRTAQGQELLKEHLVKIEANAKLFLSALKGLRRDLPVSMHACSKYFLAEFPEPVSTIGVPPLSSGASFADLREMLSFTESAIDGTIAIKNPPDGPDQGDREKIFKEIGITHANLMDVSEAAYELYQCIQTACFEFDVFNTKNIEVGCPEANILFERDSLNVAMALSRALSERAIRLDIDLMESRKRLEFGERQLK